jgi:16S rRNA (guanine(966)-N(2))-methyltransferase RsmD
VTALRITAGALRGRRIAVPKSDVRPTSERARQAYFNIVGDRIHDARFLDLFAGSGIFSFEAVSRGARASVAVDISRAHTHAIQRAARELGVPVKAVQSDVLTGIKRLESAVFDLVYADPPYQYEHYDALLAAIDSGLALGPEAVIAIEHRRNTHPFPTEPKRLRAWRTSEYGEVWITFFMT